MKFFSRLFNKGYNAPWMIREPYYRIKWLLQRIFRGYSDPQVWDFDYHTALYCLPRLQALKANYYGHPYGMTEEEWQEVLRKIIFAMQEISNGEVGTVYGESTREGLELFGKHFGKLWD